VNTLATIELPEDTPERIREILASRPEIDVRNGSEPGYGSTIDIPARHRSRCTPLGSSDHQASRRAGRPDKVLLVVSERLLPNVRRELESADFPTPMEPVECTCEHPV